VAPQPITIPLKKINSKTTHTNYLLFVTFISCKTLSGWWEAHRLEKSSYGQFFVKLEERYVVVVGAPRSVVPVSENLADGSGEDLGFEIIRSVMVQKHCRQSFFGKTEIARLFHRSFKMPI
jgi:hypothetical protein